MVGVVVAYAVGAYAIGLAITGEVLGRGRRWKEGEVCIGAILWPVVVPILLALRARRFRFRGGPPIIGPNGRFGWHDTSAGIAWRS